jgi:hypothetical protein
MGGFVGADGLTEEDRDEQSWTQSDKDCAGCGDNVKYADECVVLKLVYPAPYNGQATVLDALDENDGTLTATPLLYCYSCWDGYTEELRGNLKDLFVTKRRSAGPSPLKCSYCQTALNWGDYCGHAIYGELDVSPRTKDTYFKPSPYETTQQAELICMNCLEWVNDEMEENIWPHLWCEEENGDGQEQQEGV